MAQAPFPILYEDNHLLVIDKPAQLATMGVRPPRKSALELARGYIKEKYQKPGNVYLGVVSRLDAPATGILVFARTSKAAARLTAQYRKREVTKIYHILIEGKLSEASGLLEDWVRKDERHRRMHVVTAQAEESQQARLSYRVLQTMKKCQLVEVELETGRKHQIRLQFSSRGHPVVGDRKYGARDTLSRGIALHARRLELMHPVRDEKMIWEADLPLIWQPFL
ncbi:MAG: RNA pseudouridine synthase [Planctomycetota bacterium]|nr:RNA pseudouridine synthase [Planctomycetota bacterium]MEC8338204.1 RNA pseudouridine synthase [Planctomycetota bacterium]